MSRIKLTCDFPIVKQLVSSTLTGVYTMKLLGSIKVRGRCRVPGHGSACCVSKEIQSTQPSKAKDRQQAKKLINEEKLN